MGNFDQIKSVGLLQTWFYSVEFIVGVRKPNNVTMERFFMIHFIIHFNI